MKRPILYIFILIAFTACKKSWLNVVPVGYQVATTTDDYDQLMNDPAFYVYSYTGGWQEPMYMGDEVGAEGSYFLNHSTTAERLFRWADSVYITSDQSAPALTLHTQQVYSLNLIINGVMTAQGGTTQRKNAIRAEALATRAWSHFNMVNYYSKPFADATAATDPGFPVVTTSDVNISKFDRGTVRQSYDFIISDLKEAILYLPVRQAIATRMSKPAAQGLLGKVYLYMGKPAEALPYLAAALDQIKSNGSPVLYDYNKELAPGGSFLPIDVMNGPKGPGQNPSDIVEAVVSKVWNCGPYTQYSSRGLVLSPEAAALYGTNDLRLKMYTNRNPDNTPNAGGRLRKYGLLYARFGLQLPDLYLLSAECKARTNDLAGAVADVEVLRKARMPLADAAVPPAIATNQNALIRFIIDERTREFALEGYRWFDMRRLSVDPLFSGTSFKHKIFKEGGQDIEYTLPLPNRLVLMFPKNIMEANPDMQNNP